MIKQYIYIILGFLGFSLGTFLYLKTYFELYWGRFRYILGDISNFFNPILSGFISSPLYALILITCSLFCGLILAMLLMTRYSRRVSVKWEKSRGAKVFLCGILILYFVTWAVGVPTVQSSNTKWVIEQYKRLKEEKDTRVWEHHPYLRTFLSFPVLPFVVISYHEFQLHGIWGYGGLDIHVWYIKDVKLIFRLPLWIS